MKFQFHELKIMKLIILHQPRPTDSADINTRLQLSDTSSIPPMHGGFLLGPKWSMNYYYYYSSIAKHDKQCIQNRCYTVVKCNVKQCNVV